MKQLWRWLCYRQESVGDVTLDPATGTLTFPQGVTPDTSIQVRYFSTDNQPMRVASITKTVPRRWFKPFHGSRSSP